MDVTWSMLFEASGDSEIDGVDDATVVEEDDDDAESCSYGSSDWECVKKINEKNFDRRVEEFCLEDDDDDDDDEVVIEEEDEVEQCYCGGYKAKDVVEPPPPPKPNVSEESVVAEKFKKSEVCDHDPNLKMMNQGDRDKLFWEACLAS